MTRILRHELDIVDQQTVQLPCNGELLSVAMSRTDPDYRIDLWSVDYGTGIARSVDVFIIGTGNRISTAAEEAILMGKFLGTVVTPSALVWHVWQGAFR
jgi:hypothetical protein